MLWLGFADVAGDPGAGAPEEPLGHVPPDPSNEMVMAVIPWVISFLLHLGLVLVAIFVVWNAGTQEEEEEVIIPIARLSASPRPPLQTQVTQTQTKTSRATTSTRRTLTTITSANAPTTTAISGKVDTQSLSLGGGELATAAANPFDTGIASPNELKASFFKTGGNARRIVYLVDASGSLIDTLPFVILELKRSIGELSEKQSFTVIFFQGDDALEVPKYGLKVATAENKQRVIKWIDPDSGNITPMGLSNPIKALQLALRYKPQLLFILSDNITGQGRFEVDQKRLLADIDLNNKSNTVINTIQFLYRDPLEQYDIAPTLALIAGRTKGIYKFLDGRELGIE